MENLSRTEELMAEVVVLQRLLKLAHTTRELLQDRLDTQANEVSQPRPWVGV